MDIFTGMSYEHNQIQHKMNENGQEYAVNRIYWRRLHRISATFNSIYGPAQRNGFYYPIPVF